ncbi:MAG: hypothetical protein ACYC61_08380 [Isosphaeraceae bacterium]
MRSLATRPVVECLELRELPTSMALVDLALQKQSQTQQVNRILDGLTLQSPPFNTTPSNGTLPDGQVNQVLTPTGVPTPAESRRETFHASFVGQYTLGPGRFSTESGNFLFRGVGRTSSVLHSDIQMRIIDPTNPTAPSTGIAFITDRNLDSNSDLGFDVYAVPQQVDRLGRPTKLTIYAVDVAVSGGNYVEGLGQGTMTVHYGKVPPTPHFAPSSYPLPGARSQGTASITINAQVYGMQTAFALRNVDYNP